MVLMPFKILFNTSNAFLKMVAYTAFSACVFIRKHSAICSIRINQKNLLEIIPEADDNTNVANKMQNIKPSTRP